MTDKWCGYYGCCEDIAPEPPKDAYIANARHSLDELRSLVHDGFSSPNDLFLKVSLLQEIDAIDTNLRKALI